MLLSLCKHGTLCTGMPLTTLRLNCRLSGQAGCGEKQSTIISLPVHRGMTVYSQFCLSTAILSSVVIVTFCVLLNTIQPSYVDASFCPLQPAIVLAPINCTQTAAPQIEVPSPKPEPQTTGATNPSEDSPRQPPQETPPAEKDEEGNKCD